MFLVKVKCTSNLYWLSTSKPFEIVLQNIFNFEENLDFIEFYNQPLKLLFKFVVLLRIPQIPECLRKVIRLHNNFVAIVSYVLLFSVS